MLSVNGGTFNCSNVTGVAMTQEALRALVRAHASLSVQPVRSLDVTYRWDGRLLPRMLRESLRASIVFGALMMMLLC